MKNLFIPIFCLFAIGVFAQNAKLYVRQGNTLNTSSGFSGIGINKPQALHPLHMYDASNNSTTLKIDLEQSLGGLIGGGFQNVQPAFAIRVNRKLWGITPGSDVFSVDFDGRVKTGTSFGTEQLAVGQTFAIYRNSSNHTKLRYFGDQPEFVWTSSSSKNFRFINGNTNARGLTLSPAGKVGINTENFVGDYSLYIEGSAVAEEIFVKLKDNWGDFVFSPDYNLMPLEEVEKFVNEYHHLPNIPTAAEIEANGLALGEMERLLAVKVEELTLYVIALQKELDALKTKLEVDEHK